MWRCITMTCRPSWKICVLEFTILTACRTSKVLGARWDEIDFAKNLWAIPPLRMKAAREHRVPLSPRCLEIVDDMWKVGYEGQRIRIVQTKAIYSLVQNRRSPSRPWPWQCCSGG